MKVTEKYNSDVRISNMKSIFENFEILVVKTGAKIGNMGAIERKS